VAALREIAMYAGYFVNLDRSATRRTVLTRHLADMGAIARYQRFEAVDGPAVAHAYDTALQPGALGIWLTHERLVQGYRSPDLHLHIIEDDVLFCQSTVTELDNILQHAEAELGPWDLLFTEIFVPVSREIIQLFATAVETYSQSGAYSLLDLRELTFAGATSMVINKASISKVASLISGQWALGIPIDLYLRRLVNEGQLRARVVVPFLTTISPANDESDIRNSLDRSRRVCDALRRAFFQEADLHALRAEVDRLTLGANVSPLAEIFLKVEAFRLSDQYREF
jgi:hypothetical protein